ncbi:MAG: recombinase RecT [Pseudomonadota bacterium]
MATELKDMQADQAAGENELARRAVHPVVGKTDLLEKKKGLLGAGIPGHMTVEREIRTATVMLMQPQAKDLRAATPQSFYTAVSVAINSGIGLGNGKGYLVAYKGNVSYVPGWKGLVDLVNRTGRASAWTGVVHKGDVFDYALGDSPFLTHKPGDNEDHKDITHYYAIGRVKGAEYPHIVVWSVNKVIKHLTFYNKVGGGHYALKNDDNMDAYGRKVVLLQVIKYLPASVELENAIAAENANASGRTVRVEDTIDGNFVFIDDDEADEQGEAERVPPTDYSAKVAEEVQPSKRDVQRERAETVEVRESQQAKAADQPAREQITAEASEAFERVAAGIHKSLSLNQLADAHDMIDAVANAGLRKELNAMYRTRMGELQDVKPAAPAAEEKPARAKRVRREAQAPE